MPDTARSLSALQTLLADNTSGAITAQAVRDFLVSVYGQSNLVSKTANYTLTADDVIAVGDPSGGSFTITLPTAVSIAGRRYTIKRADASASTSTLTVATTSSQTIDGSTTLTLDLDKHWVTVVSDGSNWQIVDLGPGVRNRWRQSADVTITATGETTLLGTGVGSKTLPAGFFTVGKTVRFHAQGVYSTGASGTGTFTLNFKIGGTTVVSVSAQTFPTTNLSGVFWEADVEMTCQATGVSGSVRVEGLAFLKSSSTASNTFNMTGSAATVDTTSAQAIDLTLSLSTSVNSVSCTHATIESLN